MSAGFGFSVGDFIAAVNLLRQVGNALKDNGGARDDYLKTITKLEVTKAILSCITNFEDSGKDLATVHAIHGLASLIQNDVERFLSKIEKYQSTLGNGEAKRFGHGTVAKIRWSQSVAGEVRRLYQDLDGKTDSLGMLFNLHLSNTSSRGWKDLASAREAILHAIDNHVALPVKQVQPTSNDSFVKQDIDVLATGLQALVASHAKASTDMLSSMATKDDIRALRLMFESRSQSALPSPNDAIVLQDTSRLKLVLTIPQLQLSFKDAASILQNFSAEVTAILKIFLASFFVCFRDLLLALPQLVLLCRILRRLPPAISLVLHDNIAFEDALGRVQTLPFQQFRHWDVFETSLRCAFELVPGKQKVISGDYVLTSPGHTGRLTPRNWSLAVRPGFAVKMAITLRQIFVDGRRCPRGCGSATSKLTTTEYRCGTCGLLFAVRKRSDKVHHDKPLSDSDSETNSSESFGNDRTSFRRRQYNVVSTPKTFSLSEETEDLKAFKRIELAETPSKSQQRAVHTPGPTQQHQKDMSGQIAPPGIKPRVNVSLWEDEGTICFEVDAKGVVVARREDNHFINGTKLLNVSLMTRGRRDGILKSERIRHVVKIGPMHLKGVWIPFERALDLANRERITDLLYPLFVHNIGGLLYNPGSTNHISPVSTAQNRRDDMDFPPNIFTATLGDWIGLGLDDLQAPTTGEVVAHDSPSSVSFQGALLDGESHQAAAPHRNYALEDYQMQLMLLEQQNKKRLLAARKESES